MTELRNKSFIRKIFSKIPLILLFASVLNDYDFNYLGLKYFSFNFSYILIFYYSLKKSSLMYLLLCGAAAYLRNITLRPSLIKDWIFFLVTILIINSLLFIILNFIFNYELSYFDQIINIIYTSLFYFLFSNLFDYFQNHLVGGTNVRWKFWYKKNPNH